MPVITVPDGSKREFDQPVTLMQVAEDIGPGLAKATVCGRINGELVDATHCHLCCLYAVESNNKCLG